MSQILLNKEIVSDVFAEFAWPEVFRIEDGIAGIDVVFPKTIISFEEDSVPFVKIICGIAPLNNGMYASLQDVLSCFIPQYRWKLRLGYTPDNNSSINQQPSEIVIKETLRKQVTLINQYLLPVIKGDHSWIRSHQQFLDENNEICNILGHHAHLHPIYEKFIKGDQTWRNDLMRE